MLLLLLLVLVLLLLVVPVPVLESRVASEEACLIATLPAPATASAKVAV